MATLGELYDKAMSDDEAKKAFAQAIATKEGAEAFLAQQGCEATSEELAAFLKEKASGSKSGELDDRELEGAAAGGWDWWYDTITTFLFGLCDDMHED